VHPERIIQAKAHAKSPAARSPDKRANLKPEKDEGPKKKIYSKEKEDVFIDPNIPMKKDLPSPADLDEVSRKKLRISASTSKYS